MCGIAAIFAYHKDAPPIDKDELLRMREHMKQRGSDGCGLWISENRKIGLAHRRLSIIDLSESASQPMVDNTTGNVIVYNGEIYNYRELRSKLEIQGYRFKSSSDTEVLLHLYSDKGHKMVQDLRGMYAFAIYDSGLSKDSHLKPRTSKHHGSGLFIARDPFGIKPLYIHDDGKTIRIASQVKALLAGGKIAWQKEPAGHAGFFLWGNIPEPYTLYENIMAFEPGTTLWLNTQGNRSQKQFCSIRDQLAEVSQNQITINSADAQKVLKESLLDTVRAHLVADVPVGIFLSSGLDSTTIVALASEIGVDLHTVTLGFEEYKGTHNDEVSLAEEVAKYYGAKHQTIWVTKDEFRREYDNLLHSMDQPTIDGVNTYFVSMAAKKAGLKVALSGLGGDELFGGYPSFSQIPKSVNAFSWVSTFPGFGKTLRRLSVPIFSKVFSPKYASLIEYGGSYGGAYFLRRGLYMPWELKGILGRDIAEKGLESLGTMQALNNTITGVFNNKLKVSALEMNWYMRNQLLRDTDWSSMAHSIEVRVPLVDLQLLRTIVPLLNTFGIPGKKAMALTPEKKPPRAIMNREKTGFTIPVREWFVGQNEKRERGLRGWAKYLHQEFSA